MAKLQLGTGVILYCPCAHSILLITTPKHDLEPNKWSYCFGLNMQGELILDCAVRRTMEETGIQLFYSKLKLFDINIISSSYKHFTYLYDLDTELTPSVPEGQKFQWVKLGNTNPWEHFPVDVHSTLASLMDKPSIAERLKKYQQKLLTI